MAQPLKFLLIPLAMLASVVVLAIALSLVKKPNGLKNPKPF
ncbi:MULTISPECIES: hypothetical protein [Acinetobacter]|nr:MULTISPECIES: hypothetical protein [Acinetobacter]MDX6037836.1 hypothetical protein [Acinetobacter baumannii]